MATCEWKIYYGDDTELSNLESDPCDVPKTNVQAVVQNHAAHGHHVEHATDYYVYYDDGLWRGVDQFGLWDYLAQPGYKIVLFGRWVSNDQFKEILQRALRDPDVPKRSAWGKYERRPS